MNAGVQGMEFIAVLFNGTHGLACDWVNYGYNAVGPVKGMPCGIRPIMIIRQIDVYSDSGTVWDKWNAERNKNREYCKTKTLW